MQHESLNRSFFHTFIWHMLENACLFFVFIISHHTTNLGAQFLWIAQISLFVYLCALFFRCGQYSGRSWNSRVKTMPRASRFYAGVNMQAAKLSIYGFIYEIMCSEGNLWGDDKEDADSVDMKCRLWQCDWDQSHCHEKTDLDHI